MTKVRVCSTSDFADVDRRLFDLGSLEVGIFRLPEGLVAYENQCPHQGGPVCQGRVVGKVEEVIDAQGLSRGHRFSEVRTHVACPWHGYEYDLRTGVHPGDDKVRLRRIPLLEEEGSVYVVLDAR